VSPQISAGAENFKFYNKKMQGEQTPNKNRKHVCQKITILNIISSSDSPSRNVIGMRRAGWPDEFVKISPKM
jgi:hypothetical protein